MMANRMDLSLSYDPRQYEEIAAECFRTSSSLVCDWKHNQKGAWEMGEGLVRVVNPLCRGVLGWIEF